MESSAEISTSVAQTMTAVMLTPTVRTPKDHSTARVKQDTLEMALLARVRIFLFSFFLFEFEKFSWVFVGRSLVANTSSDLCA